FSVILVNRQTGSRTIINRKAGGRFLQLGVSALANLTPKVLLFDGHEPEASLAGLLAIPNSISILDAGSWREGTASLAGKVNYLVASERFARQATGLGELGKESDRRSCLSRLREQFPTTVVVTLGEAGLIADDGSGFRHLPAFPAEA
ncbi:MAG TPA: carbohydrate kinase, partial [Verrucomicrobiales bacterium]|nr:carbohydrate kinase [Verrucomicrobiales bacterium]